jgi:hypothetical protein
MEKKAIHRSLLMVRQSLKKKIGCMIKANGERGRRSFFPLEEKM